MHLNQASSEQKSISPIYFWHRLGPAREIPMIEAILSIKSFHLLLVNSLSKPRLDDFDNI